MLRHQRVPAKTGKRKHKCLLIINQFIYNTFSLVSLPSMQVQHVCWLHNLPIPAKNDLTYPLPHIAGVFLKCSIRIVRGIVASFMILTTYREINAYVKRCDTNKEERLTLGRKHGAAVSCCLVRRVTVSRPTPFFTYRQ